MKNKLYPTMLKDQVKLAEKYLDALPDNIKSVEEWEPIGMLILMI